MLFVKDYSAAAHVNVLLEAFLLIHAEVIDLLLLILQMAVFYPTTDEVRHTNDYVPSNNARIQPLHILEDEQCLSTVKIKLREAKQKL